MIGFVILWLCCGFFAACILYAHMQDSFPESAEDDRRTDSGMALLLGLLCGPTALLVAIFVSGFCEYGIRLPLTRRKP